MILTNIITKTRTFAIRFASLSSLLVFTACGGGASTTATETAALVECDPNDASTLAECGEVVIALTDADGDFLNYTVDVLSLSLETENGRIVETLPQTTRINFTDYVDLTELVAVANVPPATYVAGTIQLDYGNAEIFVEADGNSKEASVVDTDGNTLSQTELRITLSNRDRVAIGRGESAFLQLDFDLGASHTVDIQPTPAVAIAEHFIVAEVAPVDEKDIRVRGPLAAVSEEDMTYTVAVRPFHDRSGDFGRLVVQVLDDTEIDVDDTMYLGVEGLRALNAAGVGTATVAQGTLDTSERRFTANIVLAGSSVPGIDRDAVIGNVIARDGNVLTIRGATIVSSDRVAHFNDDVSVEIGADTRVFKDGNRDEDLSIEQISIGQRVTVRGDIVQAATDNLTEDLHIDATSGAVRLHLTHLLGMVNSVVPGQVDITLHAIDRRRSAIFDFTGTGDSAASDADVANYEIETGNLTLAALATGKAIVAYGFPTSFGSAPPDFSGRTLVDYTNVRSALGVGWGSSGTIAPFVGLSSDGLILNNQNVDIDQRHFIKTGPILIDLTELDSNTTIVARDTQLTDSARSVFYIKTADSLRQYSDFADFTDDLSVSLDGATAARSMHARGHYDRSTNTLVAHRIGILLLEP